MRLINCETFQLEEFTEELLPSYAILSHTWESEGEITYQDLVNHGIEALAETKPRSASKITGFCKEVLRKAAVGPDLNPRLRYGWVDTCWLVGLQSTVNNC